jgi:hypothetical protein
LGHDASGNSKFGRRADLYGSTAVEYSPVPSCCPIAGPDDPWQDDASWRREISQALRRIGKHQAFATIAQVLAQFLQKNLATWR